MVRRLYGTQAEDVVLVPSGAPATFTAPVAGVTGTLWTAATGGTQITDLLNSVGGATTVVAQSSGYVAQFSGPDSAGSQAAYWNSSLWLDFGLGFRVMLNPQPPIQQDTGWTTLSPLPTGFSLVSGDAAPQYRLEQNGWAHMRGSMKNTSGGAIAANTLLFTLPSTPNVRPVGNEWVPTVLQGASDAACFWRITNGGQVFCDTSIPANDVVSFAGTQFTTNTLDY